MQITRPQIIELRDALSDALGTVDMDAVVDMLGQNRENITLPKNKDEMFREIVDYYNRQNRVHQLIIVSRTKSPENPLLRRFAQDVGLEDAFLPKAEDAGGVERIISAHLPDIDAYDFVANAAAAQRRVCLISKESRPLGTGFLVGPGAVMTNHHVVEQFIKEPETAARLRFTFDFNSSGRGAEYQAQLPNWLIDDSPRVTADTQSLSAPSDAPADRLDYAVVRLDGQPGNEVVQATGEPRGWFTLPIESYEFDVERALLLYHHAAGQPLKLSIDTNSYVAQNTDGTRVWHRSNTEAGSSGSPCFDLLWNPVALHQGYNRLRGQPANRAAPLVAVRRLLEHRGKLAELEA